MYAWPRASNLFTAKAKAGSQGILGQEQVISWIDLIIPAAVKDFFNFFYRGAPPPGKNRFLIVILSLNRRWVMY